VDEFDKANNLEAENGFLMRKVADLEDMLQKIEDSRALSHLELEEALKRLSKQQKDLKTMNTQIEKMRETVLWSKVIEPCDMIDDIRCSEALLISKLEHASKENNGLNTQVHEKDALIHKFKDRHKSVKERFENGLVTTEIYVEITSDTPVQMNVEEKIPEKSREERKKNDESHLADNSKKERCHGCYVTHWPKDCGENSQTCFKCIKTGHLPAYCQLHAGAQA
jgi:hypothetical protein